MCGLYGMVGNHKKKPEILKALCILNSERGDHSAGLATIYKNSVKLHKRAIHPIKFANSDEFSSMTRNGICHIGHTRHATVGDKTDENAHPFHIGNTIGAHNGGVVNLQEVKGKVKKDYSVDSQYLIHLLDSTGGLDPARGQLTVTYHKREADEILNIMRFGNSIHLIGDESCEWIAYSSTLGHLVIAFGLANAGFTHEYELKDAEHVRIYYTEGKIKLCIGDTGYRAESYRTTYYSQGGHGSYQGNQCNNGGRGLMDTEYGLHV